MNPIILALIGLPLFAGIILRFALHKSETLALNATISIVVMILIGIGYGFATYSDPHPFFLANAPRICFAGVLLLPLVAAWLAWLQGEPWGSASMGCGMFVWWGILMFLYVLVAPFPQTMAAISVVLLLILLACANALLGTISAGFSLSAALHSLFFHGSFHYISIWKDVFEFLDIQSTPVKLLVIAVVIVSGSAEPLHKLVEDSS